MLLRAVLAIVALCAALIVIKDARHWRTGDPQHASYRTVVISVLILLGLSVACQARPSPYPVTSFEGDRYGARQVHLGPEVARAVKAKQGAKPRYLSPTRKRPPVSRKQMRNVPIPGPRPLAYEPYRVEAPVSIGEGVWRETKRVVGRPRAWCGWWLGQHLGMPLRKLWLARNWASVGSSAGGPQIGVVVVWRHHVGIITGHGPKGWIVKSGNDGGRVRERARSVADAIAFRDPHGNST